MNIHVHEERYGIEDPRTCYALAHLHLSILHGIQRLCRSFLSVTTLRSTTTYSDIPHLIHLPSDIANTRRSLFICKHLNYQCFRTFLTCSLLLESGLQLGQHLHTVALVSMLFAALRYPLEEDSWSDNLTIRRICSRSHAAALINKLKKSRKPHKRIRHFTTWNFGSPYRHRATKTFNNDTHVTMCTSYI